MLKEVVARLQTGSIPDVVRFGESTAGFSGAYVCVKMETYTIGRALRVIVHKKPGENDALDLYIFNELPDLLSNWSYTDEYGNYVTIKDAKEYTDIVVDNDDSTISMERLFYTPLIL